ncbi:hypothetical protein M3P05_02950 [Sansalvadorimonas sp. 2012CJ34-2]|uniref:Uncharacterized protein n=1 Tax=Parendozoicomonas callyspongiae TaxID=2942213 RepID=A0ABT0PC06_9GAMM|nr:hypothetical protein [Sansalvadorimonas sp. 2012CJ34-2]MCL6268909.1 hypothetical protein [Sansalvadorimonas sp. 2012CJ34-2]
MTFTPSGPGDITLANLAQSLPRTIPVTPALTNPSDSSLEKQPEPEGIEKTSRAVRIRLYSDETLADRLVPLYPGTPPTQGGDSPPSRAPVMALFDIALDEDMTEEEARRVIIEFSKKYSHIPKLELDLNSQETQKFLSALNKTGQRIRLRAPDYSRIRTNAPELIYGRFVIDGNNVVNSSYSPSSPTTYVEYGSHPDAIMAGLLELLTCEKGVAQLCLKERQEHHELSVLKDILGAYINKHKNDYYNNKLLPPDKQQFEAVKNSLEPIQLNRSGLYSQRPHINPDLAASLIDSTRKLAMEVAPELTQRCVNISHYLHDPIEFLPQLANLGQRIITVFQQQTARSGTADSNFPHYYFGDEFNFKLTNDRVNQDISPALRGYCCQISKTQATLLPIRFRGSYYPQPIVNTDKLDGSTKMDDWVSQHKLHHSLALAAGKDGRVSPQFLGFLKPKQANVIVTQYGSFRDHALSCNPFHTKNVHDLQMAVLRDKQLMDDSFLPQILCPLGVENGNDNLWPNLFDANCLVPETDSYLGDQVILRPSLALNSPNIIIGLLSSQNLSRSIALCADKAQPDTLGKLFHRLCSPDKMTDTPETEMREGLRMLSLQINALEVSIISSNYKDLKKIGTYAAPLFAERFTREGRPFEQTSPARRAIELYEKASDVANCNFIADSEITDIGRKVYEPQVLRDKNGAMLESEDGTCYLLPGGHLINKDFTVLYKNHSLD